MKKITQISDGYPATGSVQIKVLTTIITIIIKATIQKATPKIDAIASGAVENAKIPSSEYKKSFQKLHVVVPATRSTFSYSIYLVLNPTQLKVLNQPFVLS